MLNWVCITKRVLSAGSRENVMFQKIDFLRSTSYVVFFESLKDSRYGRVRPKIIFFHLCYLIRVEYEKCSAMCVWIVRFGQKLRKWDYI
jgi:hypothetical protein